MRRQKRAELPSLKQRNPETTVSPALSLCVIFSYLKSKFLLQYSVEYLTATAGIRLVEAIIRAHDVGGTGLDCILKWPVRVGQCLTVGLQITYQRYSSCIVLSSILDETA